MEQPNKPWVILGRDGVINHLVAGAVLVPADVEFIAGSLEAIAKLHGAGYKLVVAINHSAVSRGIISREALNVVHAHIETQIEAAGGKLQGIFVCPHLPEDACDCRKPRTGLLDQIEQTLNADLTDALVVGDSLKDIKAAKAKNCKAVLVRTGNGTQTEASILLWPKYGRGTQVFDNLQQFANDLLSN